jgi:hypothetical protein
VALTIGKSHDLMDPLATESKVVSNLRQGLSPKPSLTDLSIPSFLATWPRPKRPPLPTGKHLQRSAPVRRELALPIALTGVVDPVTKPELRVAETFDMSCRDCAVPFPDSELVQRTDVQEELLRVVHAVYNSDVARERQPGRGMSSENAKKVLKPGIPGGRSCSVSCYGGGKHE